MLVKKYWKSIIGAALWLWPIWDFIKSFLDWRGRIDALASSYHDIGGYHVMIAYLLNPPSWIYPPFMIAGLALIWWNFHRTHRNIHHVEIREHMGIGTSVSPTVVRSAIQDNDQYEHMEWDKLFLIDEEGKTLKLRFLPDTKRQSQDACLLILFGYKEVFGFSEIKSSILNQEIRRAFHECPNRPNQLYFMTGIYAALANGDYGSALKDSGLAERIRLSEGGFFRLTERGESLGLSLAYDAILRA